jgi:phosphate:Na+ symporter
MRSKFDEQLYLLNNSLIEMCGIVERAIRDANKALVEQDTTLARKIIASDDEIDNMEKESRLSHIKRLKEGTCTADAGVIFQDIIANFERIGDHSNNISHIPQGRL